MSNDQKDRIAQVGEVILFDGLRMGVYAGICNCGCGKHVIDVNSNGHTWQVRRSEVHPLPVEQPKDEPLSEKQVDRIIEVVLKWIYKSGEIDYNLLTSLLPEEQESGETKYVADLRSRLLKISTTR